MSSAGTDMTNYRYLTAIHIEGAGQPDQFGQAGGYVFYKGSHAPPSSALSVDTFSGSVEFDWLQCLKISSPKTDSVDPFTGELRGGDWTFEVEGSDAIAQILQHTQTVPAALLTGDLTTAETDIPLDDANLQNKVVWIGDEAILLSESYSSGNYVGSTRAVFGSTAQEHTPGDYAFSWVPKWENRVVTVLRYDVDADTIDVVGKAFIDDITAPSPDTIQIQTSDYITRLLNAEVNRTPVNLNVTGGVEQRGAEAVVGSRLRGLNGSYVVSGVLPRAFPSGETTRGVALQLGDALLYGIESKDGPDRFLSIYNELPERVRLGSKLELESPDESESSKRPYRGDILEVFVIDRDGDEDNTREEYISATRDLPADERYHPVALAKALIVSRGKQASAFSFQVFGEDWALGMDYVDTDSFDTELAAAPELDSAIDHLVWGWGQSTVRLGEKIRQLLRVWGFFLTTSAENKLGLKRLRTLDIGSFTEALANQVEPFPGKWGWSSPRSSQSNTLFARVGELPFRSGSTVNVTSEGTSKRTKLLADKQSQIDVEAISRSKALSIAQQLANVALIGHYGLPTVTVNVPSEAHSGGSYGLGQWISFKNVPATNRVIIDRNGDVVNGSDVEGRIDLIGMIVSRKLDLDSYAAELGVLLLAFRTGSIALERAPSMFVTDTASSNTRLYCSATSEFGADTPDNETFTVGDEVRLWRIDSVHSGSGVVAVTAIGSDGTGDYLDVSPGFTSVSHDISIVRLADSGEFSNDVRYSATVRPYAYLAQVGSLTTTVGNEDPDPYGGTIGVSA